METTHTTTEQPLATEPTAPGQPKNGNVAATGFHSAEDWLDWASQQA